MPRLNDAETHGGVAERVKQRRGGHLTKLDRLLLHSPPVADGWNSLLGAIRCDTTLPPDVRELVICKVALINQADYEWAAHAPLARSHGVSRERLAALRTGQRGTLSPLQQVAVDYAEAMTREISVPDDLFTAVREHFDERGVVELTATVGAYNLVSRFLVALDIQPDGPVARSEQ